MLNRNSAGEPCHPVVGGTPYRQTTSETALLGVDVQNDVMAESVNAEAVVTAVATLVTNARRADIPAIWVQHSDQGLQKGVTGGASFSSWNRRRAAGRAQDLGAFYGGIHRGCDITLVADAHITRDMREHGLPHGPDEVIRVLNAQAAWTKQPDAVGSVTTTAEAFA
ncbi:isochorismatase family protein [Dermacoccus barathri]|uniref:Cysteine hydrolase family protein n=1 Tax=Dermacoccus barathri TaxID=322601 RepID=A0ABN2BRS1_9MICO